MSFPLAVCEPRLGFHVGPRGLRVRTAKTLDGPVLHSGQSPAGCGMENDTLSLAGWMDGRAGQHVVLYR